MKKPIAAILLSFFVLSTLSACNEADAYIEDKTAQSIYGQLTNFNVSKWKAGQVLTFTAVPDSFYRVNEVTHNGQRLVPVVRNSDGSEVYQTTLSGGKNTLSGKYKIKTNVDVVAEYKLSDVVNPEVLSKVIDTTEKGNDTGIDFRRAGIEKMHAPMKYNSSGQKVKDKDAFVNFVDGDTTHIESFNLGYTIKIRYLGINTPESTSEMEEWGLTASNYNKFLYTGDESYLDNIDDKDYLKTRLNGASSVILISDAVARGQTVADNPGQIPETREMEEADLKIGQPLSVNGPFHATTDGYQRNLAYVWYATVKNPTMADFRCLNLEMVYQGLSLGIGSSEDTSPYTYRFFAAAMNSAQANARHIYSTYEDNNYYYYDQYDPDDPTTFKWKVQDLTLTRLYESCTVKDDQYIGYDVSTSPLADKKTLYRISGYVSAKIGTSFYIQEKYEYDKAKVLSKEEKPFGIYVFTLRQMPIRLGDHLDIIGAVTTYGGTFQMQGITYTNAYVNPNRDTLINANGHTRHRCVPIQIDGAQFNSLKLPSVLVEITDDIYFYDFTTEYKSNTESISEGGSEEVNKYNTSYPFYNTNNTPIFYGSYSNDGVDHSAEINASFAGDSSIRYTDQIIRFSIADGVNISYRVEDCRSWRFFAGGTYYYNTVGAKYANNDPDNPYLDKTIERTYQQKAHKMAYAEHGLICMSRFYESTGGNRKMSAEIVSNDPADIDLCLATWTPEE